MALTRRRMINRAAVRLNPATQAHNSTLGRPVQPTQAPAPANRKGSPPPRPSRFLHAR